MAWWLASGNIQPNTGQVRLKIFKCPSDTVDEDTSEGVVLTTHVANGTVTGLHPEDIGMVEKIAFVTFTHNTSHPPMPYLERLLELDPTNASAYHNIATLQMQARQLEAAAASCRRAACGDGCSRSSRWRRR